MVFPTDPQWQRDLDYVRKYHEEAANEVRYRSWGTEELLIRCIRKNMPWIRDIIIVLARESQVQGWMKSLPLTPSHWRENSAGETAGHKEPRVRVVFHKEFIPEEQLPTFNSRAIEMYLHRIPGLSDYFIYGNDDMFPIGALKEEEFFRVAMTSQQTGPCGPCVEAQGTVAASGTGAEMVPCLEWKMMPCNRASSFHQACMNGINFVGREFGRHYTTEWMHLGHNIIPMKKATCERFWQQHEKEMAESVTRFRLAKNFNQYIYSWWQIMAGEYVEYSAPHRYVSTKSDINEIVTAIREAEGLLCINDNEGISDITNLAAIVRNEIAKRL